MVFDYQRVSNQPSEYEKGDKSVIYRLCDPAGYAWFVVFLCISNNYTQNHSQVMGWLCAMSHVLLKNAKRLIICRL